MLNFFNKNWIYGTIIFLLLGLVTRFAFLESPKEVVFDEFHFFHFVSEYEKGEYFFDIHPPLGKLILWENAKMYGISDFVEEVKASIEKKEMLEKEKKQLEKKIIIQKETESEDMEKIKTLRNEYEDIKDTLKTIKTGGLETYTIGAEYNNSLNVFGMRSVPAFFGALLVPLMFLFAFFLTRSFPISIIVGSLTLFSPAFITESQYILMDSMLMFFMVLGTFFAFLYYKKQEWKWWIGTVFCIALSVSIKWTGISLFGIAGLVWIFALIKDGNWKKLLMQALSGFIFIISFYMAIFAIHFSVLPFSGEGDAFHSPEFRKNLENSIDYNNEEIATKTFFINPNGENWILKKIKNINFDEKNENPANYQKDEYIYDWDNWKLYGNFIELNRQMGERSAGIRNKHPFSSRPKDWVEGKKSIYLWNKEEKTPPSGFIAEQWNKWIGGNFEENTQCRDVYQKQLHLLPNNFVWKILPFSTFLLGIIILAFAIRYSYVLFVKHQKAEMPSALYFFLFAMIIANIAPFVLIERPQFLYHAFEYVLFAMLGFGGVLSFISNNGSKKYILWFLAGAIIVPLFIFFIIELPLIYGFSFHDCMGKTMFNLF